MAILLSLSVALLHAAAPHMPSQPDCRACKALSSPMLGPPDNGPGLTCPSWTVAIPERQDDVVPAGSRCLSLLRAPPIPRTA